MISTHWRKTHQPSERDLRNLDILARQAADLIEYRRRHERLVERVVSIQLPTEYGLFTAIAFRETLTGRDHLALVVEPGRVRDLQSPRHR